MNTMRMTGWTALAMLALTGGCATGGDIGVPPMGAPKLERQDADVPASFRDAPPAPASQTAAWWSQFADPTLDALVRAALDEAISVEQAEQRVIEARNVGRSTIAGFAPRVTASASSDTNVALGGPDLVSATGGREDSQTTGSGGLRASWEVPLFGRLSSALQGSRANVAAAEADLEAAKVAIVADLAAAYVDLRVAQTALRYLEEDLERATRLVRIAEARRNVGLIADADAGQARGEQAQVRGQLPDARLRVRAALDRIAILRGVSPGTLDQTLAPRAEERFVDVAPLVESAPADLLRRRPDVRRAEQNALVAAAAVGVARADLYPRVSITGAVTTLTALAGAPIGQDISRGSVSPAIDLPLFDFGQRRAALRTSDARFQQALLAYRATTLGAVAEGQQALASYAQSRERVSAAIASERAARERHTATSRAFDEGLLALRERLEADRALSAARQNRLSAQARASDAAVGLYRTFAGGPGI